MEILLVNTPRWASKVLPCQAKRLMTSAISLLNTVPGAMIAVPLAEPSGTGPAGLLVNKSSRDRKSTRLNSSHLVISYAVFCLKKTKQKQNTVGNTRLINQELLMRHHHSSA